MPYKLGIHSFSLVSFFFQMSAQVNLELIIFLPQAPESQVSISHSTGTFVLIDWPVDQSVKTWWLKTINNVTAQNSLAAFSMAQSWGQNVGTKSSKGCGPSFETPLRWTRLQAGPGLQGWKMLQKTEMEEGTGPGQLLSWKQRSESASMQRTVGEQLPASAVLEVESWS